MFGSFPVARVELVRKLLDRAVVSVGNGDRVVAVFFDLRCPFCAKFFLDVEEALLELANRGRITYAMCDFLVHREAEPLHRALRCVPPDRRLQFIKDVYEGKNVDVGKCKGDMSGCVEVARELGIKGTPSTLFFNLARGLGHLRFGYVDTNSVLDAISRL